MKICILTTTHKPLDNRIFHKESKSLSKFYDVTIIAPDDEEWKKNVDGVKIIAIKKPKNKILHFITLLRVFVKGLKQDFDIYHCHELDSLAVGILIKLLKKNKVKVIYDVHEHWPSEIAYDWFKIRGGLLGKIIEHISSIIEQILTKHADCIIAVSRSVGFRFKQASIIPNAPLNSILTELKDNGDKDSDIVIMGGGLQSYHGINEILLSLSKIKEHYPEIKLKIIGNIKINVKSILEKYGLDENVILTGFLTFEEMYKEIKKGKIGLVILKAEYYNAYIGLPNKLFDYMACGLAVIGSNYPEISRIVKTAKCGILVNPNDVNEIANAILYLIENPSKVRKMGIRGRKFVERKMNWNLEEKKLVNLYQELGGDL